MPVLESNHPLPYNELDDDKAGLRLQEGPAARSFLYVYQLPVSERILEPGGATGVWPHPLRKNRVPSKRHRGLSGPVREIRCVKAEIMFIYRCPAQSISCRTENQGDDETFGG